MSHHMHISVEFEECLNSCQECHEVCVETVQHCLGRGSSYATVNHISLLLDCAEICRTTADFMLRGSMLHPYVCGACAPVCESCAQSCEQMIGDNDQLRACAEICRRCAESCHAMAGSPGMVFSH